jgi:hypothetical protein
LPPFFSRDHDEDRPMTWYLPLNFSFSRKFHCIGAVAVAACLALGLSNSPRLFAQSPQKAAGGKMSFQAVSIKVTKGICPASGPAPYSNFPLDSSDVFPPNGGLFLARNVSVLRYVIFAYKLTPSQASLLGPQLPGNWVAFDRFDIQARASADTTKDEVRLMMQSLLADRIKLAAHWEVRHVPKSGTIRTLVIDHIEEPTPN